MYLVLISTNRTTTAIVTAPCTFIHWFLIKAKPMERLSTHSAVKHLENEDLQKTIHKTRKIIRLTKDPASNNFHSFGIT